MDFLLPPLQLEQNRRGHQPILSRAMYLPSSQQDMLEIFYGLLSYFKLMIILNHDTMTSTIPFRLKSLPVW
jgi:hypothetical protein